ncbi:formimidoylglutamate deiminase [Sulfitobacter mediterraneus]|uniref:formimidoylglutamate deiminase n=1 Tax=Sulfitobacter mediterraneus TaxID=83219 RepID=UPI00193A0C62|nr:formimidoylglutamate deiminase [Sulfitobacter mediterraneus]MBM1557830.1 formimidoylglutamate deiminase [Sulfitobacter mediterraneus]MBM1568795.1 formimidoylglutamate deiminase [Sulfitobacter mediterraneus]MBM1573003.1 formimidoylglutamate deiminase [Sulfitobacter mediterraneus]MBM1576204.1 formimidoylglutamate deiminase [Sulfitobacter mediterraneus]MBM1580788.1 formimidoylglutamate deiminase [Sulfitobacter mediterraneus]
MTKIKAKTALLPHGWANDVTLTLKDGRITAIGEGPADTQVDILMPAPTNLHSHAFQRAMGGLTERRGAEPTDSFWTWRQLMFRFLDQLTPEDIQAITAQVQMEMLEAGYAASVEFHYLHHQPGGHAYDNRAELATRIAAAAEHTGVGLTLLPVLYAQGGVDGRALGPGQIRFGNDLDGYQTLWDGAQAAMKGLPADANIGVAPHSLRAVTPDQIRALQSFGDPIHMHLAEQVAEVEEIEAAYGARPVEWALANVEVDSRWCMIHCTQMTEAETRGLAATGAVAGLCPLTESSLGDGIFNGVTWSDAKGVWGIGSDSNILISLAQELRTLEYSQRLSTLNRAVMATEDRSTGRVLFDGVCRGGAQAAGRKSGAIEVGAWADLMALDGDATDLIGREGDNVLDTWIFAGTDTRVTDVWAAGRHMVQDGMHIARTEITNAYRETLHRLKDVM